ncbi:MAG: class A beta-lactamase-related serine hydrolase [Candidatus Omnitrophica bacterium]|nr:class A beta-lactamase-related serine hydrolase [Candidatus Omnitrophota bacterium]MCF7893895.1 class A beta-lactamase-related serine hydrolase [Candidatus Omnitrophota bacterium]
MNTIRKKNIKLKTCLYFCLSLFLIAVIFAAFGKVKQKIRQRFLEKQINSYTSEFSGESSFIIYKPGFFGIEFAHNPNEKIAAASLIKLPILAASFKAVDGGRIEFEQKVIVAPKDITGGSGIFKKVAMPLSLTFKELLSFMIMVSDNSATNKVIDLLGMDYINQSFLDFNLKDTVLERKMMDFSSRKKGFENYTSSRDIVTILKMIYHKKLINRRFSLLARDLLSHQQYNDRIAYLLPEEIEVAHKTGLERGVVHDAGIVYGKKSDFIICVLTQEVKNYREAKKFIANLSQLSYNFLN